MSSVIQDIMAAAAIAIAITAAGCGSARRDEPAAPPVKLRTAMARRGELVFMRECTRCHPGGEAGLGPALNDKPLPGSLIRFQVRNGLGAMPAFPKELIPDPDLDAVVAYLKALRRAPGPESSARRSSSGCEQAGWSYVSRDADACRVTLFSCAQGTPFFDEACGCGCRG